MNDRQKEALRYLGYGRNQADEVVTQLLEECFYELEKNSAPKTIHRSFPLIHKGENKLDMGGIMVESSKLSAYLKDCHEVVLFAATLGLQVDQLIQRYLKIQMSKAVVMQAAATVCIEEYCDSVCDSIRATYQSQNCNIKSRFSPGYGDFSLNYQKQLAAVLEVGKRIGITLTDSLLMSPSKSVTAVIGVTRSEILCRPQSCSNCEKTDCTFRKEGVDEFTNSFTRQV